MKLVARNAGVAIRVQVTHKGIHLIEKLIFKYMLKRNILQLVSLQPDQYCLCGEAHQIA